MVVICITSTFCKKSSGKNSNCRIVTATGEVSGNTNIYNITYNDDGKIAAMVTSGGLPFSREFTYSGNTIIVNVTASGAFFYKDSITLNNRGPMVNLRRYFNTAGTNWINRVLEYNGDVLLKHHLTSNASATPQTSIVTVTNGNTTKVQGPAGTINYEYWTDKNIQQGDFMEFFAMIEYGVNFYPHKNLIKTIDFGGGDTHNFDYELNADGLISKITLVNGSTTNTYSYQYACN
jgi:hypothetical protein